MKKMLEASNISQEKIIQVATTNTYQNLVEQTQMITEKMGTQNKQKEWEKEFTKTIDIISKKAKEKGVLLCPHLLINIIFVFLLYSRLS
ncbi:MAG: hypothetical protein AB2421_02080 [Thermotaleaceae bacterium]